MSEQDVLSMDEAMRLLRKEVANKGEDFVYDADVHGDGEGTCIYVKDGMGSCVVGNGLLNAGVVSYGFLRVHNAASVTQLVERGAPISVHAALVLLEAQETQDRGQSWGTALVAAERKYRELGGTE